jgi:hypothetical protein
MDVPTNSLTITKVEGAIRQIEAAIRALVSGDFDVAITLAGAAEDMVEQPKSHLFKFFLDSPELQQFDKALRISVLNRERDWLKHVTPDGPLTLTIQCGDAAFMIARALSKIDQWTPPMQEFKNWYMDNLSRLEHAGDRVAHGGEPCS